MRQIAVVALLTSLAVAVGAAAAADDTNRSGGSRPGWGCQPVLPVLDVSVDSDVIGNGIRSCELINTPTAWAAYCAEHGLVCDPFDEDFFDEWTMVAIAIDTDSPVVCENAGLVPGWELGCLTVRGAMVRARVSAISAGGWCQCSSNPQWPVRRHLVQAIAAVDAADCRAWQENHLIECLPGF